MSKSVTRTPKNGTKAARGAALTDVEVMWFLYYLEREGNAKRAALRIGKAPDAFKMRRQRNARFRAAYDLAMSRKHTDRIEDFFAKLELTGEPLGAFLAAGLSRDWYREQTTKPAFVARVEEVAGRHLQAKLEEGWEVAKESPALLWKLIERMTKQLAPR